MISILERGFWTGHGKGTMSCGVGTENGTRLIFKQCNEMP